MDDLISRQRLMKEFTDFVRKSNNSDFAQTPTWNDAVSLVGSMPSAQRWIPVTERLPEEADGTVLVCMPEIFPYNAREPYINAKHNQQVEMATYSQYSDRWYFAMGAVTSIRPIAWMPLPEPLKGEEDESTLP